MEYLHGMSWLGLAGWKWFFFFSAVAPPGLFGPDVVHQTFFVVGSPGSAGPQKKTEKHHPGLAEVATAHSE